MTKHIANQIDIIIHKGGYTLQNLKSLVDVLEDIRSAESIEIEFKEAFEWIEQTKGKIHPNNYEIFNYITSTKKYHYVNSYDGNSIY
jgi:hypothetical protein